MSLASFPVQLSMIPSFVGFCSNKVPLKLLLEYSCKGLAVWINNYCDSDSGVSYHGNWFSGRGVFQRDIDVFVKALLT